MTTKSTNRLNPTLLLVAVGFLVLAAVGVGVLVNAKRSGTESPAEVAKNEAPGKKSSRPAGSPAPFETPLNSRKSDGFREGTRPDQSPGRHVGSGGSEALFVQVSINARDELKRLRESHATAFDDPEERRAFGERLSQITDPLERQRVLRGRTEEMRRARAEADAAKSVQEREREKELIALMQVQNLWRMAEFVSKNPDLRAEVEAFDENLARWVQNVEQMDSATFHSSFNSLRDTVNDLRQRNAKTVHPQANSANLPSRRPERKSGE